MFRIVFNNSVVCSVAVRARLSWLHVRDWAGLLCLCHCRCILCQLSTRWPWPSDGGRCWHQGCPTYRPRQCEWCQNTMVVKSPTVNCVHGIELLRSSAWWEGDSDSCPGNRSRKSQEGGKLWGSAGPEAGLPPGGAGNHCCWMGQQC